MSCYRQSVSGEEFPILGEPLPIEFANTRYGEGDEQIDFLGTAPLVRLWIQATPLEHCLPTLKELKGDGIFRVQTLRDLVHGLADTMVEGATTTAPLLHTLNTTAALAPVRRELKQRKKGCLQLIEARSGPPLDRLLSTLANETITLFGGASGTLLHRCPGPGCSMFFIKRHHRRRFCHESCSHRARQASYYRRQINAVTSGAIDA